MRPKASIKIEDTRTMITKTEDGLRDLIDSVLTRAYGAKWENNSQIGWSNDKKHDLENRRKDRQLKFPEQTHTTRLLYYGYVYHLNYLIEKNNLVFKLELDDVKKVTTYLKILGENRNLLMHSDDVDEYQKYLCLGICGYLQQIVKKWKLGYKRKAKRWEADIRLSYSVSMDEEAAKKEVQKLANAMVAKLKLKATKPIVKNVENNKTMYEISIKKDRLLIYISRPAKRNYSRYGIFQCIDVHLSSINFESMSKILEELSSKNWVFTWIIPEGLDAIFTIDKIEQIRRVRFSGSKSYQGNELTGRGMDFYLQDSNERTIRASIMGGKDHPTKITLVFNGAGPDDGFTNAHNVFSPDEILAICYGERTPIEVLKLLDEACS